jgi:serine/threonine protein kinase
VTENAYAVMQSRKSDVYSYGVVLLELITRKKVLVHSLNDETKATTLVSWARSIWLETGKIEEIVDPYITSSFPNSVALTKQVMKMFLLALQCTETDPRKRPTMKDVIDLYNNVLRNWRCSEVDYGDPFVADTTLQPYSPCNIFSKVPVVSTNHHLHGERCRARILRKREVTFNVETETQDNSDFRFWQDADQFPLGVYDWDDWKLMSKPAVGIDGLVIKLMGNCEMEAKTVVVAALIVSKITYSQPCLIYLPSTTGPTFTELFNWFFLSHWGQYMHQQKSLCYQPKSYFINANEIKSLQDLVLVATENLNEQYIIGRGVHGIVYKVILGQKVFTVKKFEFGRNKQSS